VIDGPGLIYPTGSGGRWLSYMLWAVANNEQYQPGLVNFHDRQESSDIIVSHTELGTVATYYYSGTCSFNFYLNFWYKMRCNDNYEDFNKFTALEQLHELSNDARWRMGTEYQSFYQQKIDIDYRNLILDPDRFYQQLQQVIQELSLPLDVTPEYFATALANFRDTMISPASHVGNVHSMPWRAWCLAMLEHNNCPLPTLYSDWDGITEFLNQQQDWLVEQSLPYIQYH
jgi:hypothetical protein